MCWSAFTVSTQHLGCAAHNSQECWISWLQHSLLVSIISWRMYAWKHHSSPFSKTKLPKLSGKRLNYSSWIWSVEEAALLSGVTNKDSEAAPCACAEIKGTGIITESPAQSVNSGELSEPRGRPMRGDGDSWQAAMPGGSGTGLVTRGWLNSLVFILPSLPQGQQCVTVTQPCTPLQPWEHSQMELVVNVCFAGGEMMMKCLGQTHPKGQQKWE